MKSFKTTDLRNTDTFPNETYRFSTLTETDEKVTLTRDFLGENPLHYYMDSSTAELIVANNISTIKQHLEGNNRKFVWERVRAVSNNTAVTIDDDAFLSTAPNEIENGPILQEYRLSAPFDPSDIRNMGTTVRELLENSLETRLSTIDDTEIGLLLSGGLDSMSVGHLLSKTLGKKVVAYTLKVSEDDQDVVKSRELAKRFGIDLSEVKVTKTGDNLSVTLERYSPTRALLYKKQIAQDISIGDTVRESLRISGSPKKDNLFCAAAMYLIGQAVKSEGIKTVFCGEGPNEMINDYGYNPKESGYATEDKGDLSFREALTFGLKKTDRQLGRGGLAKHASARMSKIFAHYGLRLESPYYGRDIARVMTLVPHLTGYDTIKQHLVGAMFSGEGLDGFIQGTAKEKFQDGSGVSRIFKDFTQDRLSAMFVEIYGVVKNYKA